jgi:hypothetical protein
LLLATLVVTGVAAVAAYAALPSRSVPPKSVPLGTLAGQTSVNVLSVGAFMKTLNQAHGTNAVLQHTHFGLSSRFRPYGGAAGSVSKWSALPAQAAG